MSKQIKDFKQVLTTQAPSQSPYVYVTDQVTKIVENIHNKVHSQFLISMLISTSVIAPLQTIATSLQISVQPHKDIYKDMTEAKGKQLARLNTQMTVHQKRNFQLMIRAGGKGMPYIAPVYSGLREAIEGLFSQGWRAFYKGLGLRLFHQVAHFSCYQHIGTMISQSQLEGSKGLLLLKMYASVIACDLITNPFQVLENRHIVQSGIPQFKIFRKGLKDIVKLTKVYQAMLGWRYHLINNTIGFTTSLPLYINLMYSPSEFAVNAYPLFLIGETIMFPIQTAYKRIICQTERYAGMIPKRYESIGHCLKVMAYEEGVRGLYRGYPISLIGTLLKLELIRGFTIAAKNKKKQEEAA